MEPWMNRPGPRTNIHNCISASASVYGVYWARHFGV